MNTTEFAQREGVHYQTVNRIVRKLLAEDGTKAVKGKHFLFSQEFEQRVLDRLNALRSAERAAKERAVSKKAIRSTEAQRREWEAEWAPAFMAEKDWNTWAMFACVLAAISHSKTPGLLSERLSTGKTIGDAILFFSVRLGVDRVFGGYSGFTGWLIDNGFEAKEE